MFSSMVARLPKKMSYIRLRNVNVRQSAAITVTMMACAVR
jgi:hypothetical protein